MEFKILICDDEKNIGDVLESYFLREGYKVDKALDGVECMEKFKEFNPDIVILDVMMPKMDGQEVCKKIREESDIPILMLTARIEEDDILDAFDIGADDYITKPFSPRQVVARVKARMKRRVKNLSEKDNSTSIILDQEKKVLMVRGEEVKLTATEYKLMVLFTNNKNRVFSREELMNITLGIESDSYDRVIDTHIKNLRKKIEEDSKKPKYIKTVHGLGYRFGGE